MSAMHTTTVNVPSLHTTFSNEVLEMQLNSDGQSRGSSKNNKMLNLARNFGPVTESTCNF
ncbi:hypothetical protein TSUD_44760 [Trifolium subterraneum]|nr:hypothetical protein TSUD_44760 [Trifolium subterraneum]